MSDKRDKQEKSTLARRVLMWVNSNGSHPKAVPMLGGLSAGDFFVPALPTQTSVMLLSCLQPKRGVRIVMTFSLAAAVGVMVLALIAYSLEGYLISAIPQQGSDAYQHWLKLQSWTAHYGLWALLFMSMLPTPPRLLVMVNLISGVSWVWVVATVFLGKLVWFSLVVILVSKAPHFLQTLPWVGPKLQHILKR